VVGRSVDRQRTASTSNAYLPSCPSMIHQLPLPDRLQSFRRITSGASPCRATGRLRSSSVCHFLLELTQSLHLRRHETTVLLAPIVVSGLADPGLAADLTHRCAFLALAQNERNLRLAKLRSLHDPSSSNGPNHSCAKLEFSSRDRSENREAGQPVHGAETLYIRKQSNCVRYVLVH
jgi:hypothetical protein